jgi:hypothetical protein
MKILAVYKEVLIENSGINDLVDGRIFAEQVDQNAERSNILLELPDSGSDYTHSGPVNLIDAHLRVTCRCATAGEAADLGELVFEHLRSWKGSKKSLEVMLTAHFKTSSNFDKSAQVFQHVSEYTSYFRKVSP